MRKISIGREKYTLNNTNTDKTIEIPIGFYTINSLINDINNNLLESFKTSKIFLIEIG